MVDAKAWRSTAGRIGFVPEPGDVVIVSGTWDFYAPTGRASLIVDRMKRAEGGESLLLRLAQLRERLQKEGLFDPDQKQELPFFPRRIAVLTAEGSAALTDVQRTAALRCPATELLLHHIPVQGDDAAPRIAEAIAAVDAESERLGIEAILVTRGGGSMEDLWCFNDEAVVRAVAKCQLPVVSAIGHERDESLIDLVADVRASTPTQAIMKLLPDREEELEMLAERAARLQSVTHRSIERRRLVLQRLERAVQVHHPQRALAAQQEKLVQLRTRLRQHAMSEVTSRQSRLETVMTRLRHARPLDKAQTKLAPLPLRLRRAAQVAQDRRRKQWTSLEAQLRVLSHRRTLERGFALVHGADGLVRDPSQIKPDERLRLELAVGDLTVRPEVD
jgi:exodeoxyribonuclease VII large subunit